MKIQSALLPSCMLALFVLCLTGCQKSGVEAGNVTPSGPTNATSTAPAWDEAILGEQGFLASTAKSLTRMKTMSSVVLKRSGTVRAKEYAQRTLDNYTGALQQLSDLMKKKGAAKPASLPEVTIAALSRLQNVPDAAVDPEFISLMTAEQQQLIPTFRNTAETAADPDVRAFAKGVLPILQKDYDDALGIEKKMEEKEHQE
jgi:predicted outer membrane protein